MKPRLRFYYRIEGYPPIKGRRYPEPDFIETGVGFITKKNKKFIFTRETPLFSGESRDSLFSVDSSAPPYYIGDTKSLVIFSIKPASYDLALSSPHCVITSNQAFSPTPVELEENSLLGRKDNRVQSIDKDELREILTDDSICDAVNQNSTPVNRW